MSGGDGGIRTLQAHNDDGAEEFNVIDISKLKTVVAETGVSRNIPPKPALTPSKPKPFRPLIEGRMEHEKVCANQKHNDRSKTCSIAAMSAVTNAFPINGHN
jgi:hypothetical protein